MAVPTRTDRTAVAARAESGQLRTVTVQRDPLGQHLLCYEGSETTAAETHARGHRAARAVLEITDRDKLRVALELLG